MAGEGVPYEAQSESFPSVAVPHSDLGAPYIIKPEDWYRMFEAEGGVTGSILPDLTKITQAGTSLLDNTYNRQLEYQKSLAQNAETQARAKYYGAEADNISSQVGVNLKLKDLDVQKQQQAVDIQKHTVNDLQWHADQDKKATDDYGNWMADVTKLDPLAADYDTQLAEVNAKHSDASQNKLTMGMAQSILARNKTIRDNNDEVTLRNNQLTTLTDPANKPYLPQDFKARDVVNSGNGAAAIDAMNRAKITERYQTVRPYATQAQRSWIDSEITRLNGVQGGAAGESAPPDQNMLTPRGTLNADSEANLKFLEGTYAAKPGVTKTVTTEQPETKTTPKITTQYTVPMSAEEQRRAQEQQNAGVAPTLNMDVQKAMQGTQAWSWVADQLNKGNLTAPTGQTPEEQNRWLATQWTNRIRQTGEKVPQTIQDEINRYTKGTTAGAAGTPTPEPGASPTPVQPPPLPATGAKPRVRTRRGVPLAEEGEGTEGRLAVEPVTTAPAEGEPTPIPARLANATQVQGAPQAFSIPGDARTLDWNNFKFGPATTFGLNYNGSIDRGDNGVGAMGHNTRDPRLVGASVSVPDMQRTFGANVVTLQPDGSYKTNPRFAQLARNGDIQVQVIDPSGRMVQMPIVDVGPGASTHNRIDLTYAASRLFRTEGKSILGYQFVDRYGRPLTTG